MVYRDLRLGVAFEAQEASHACGIWHACSGTTLGSWPHRCLLLSQSALGRSCLDRDTCGRKTPGLSAEQW